MWYVTYLLLCYMLHTSKQWKSLLLCYMWYVTYLLLCYMLHMSKQWKSVADQSLNYYNVWIIHVL